jgi:hypothetical protein
MTPVTPFSDEEEAEQREWLFSPDTQLTPGSCLVTVDEYSRAFATLDQCRRELAAAKDRTDCVSIPEADVPEEKWLRLGAASVAELLRDRAALRALLVEAREIVIQSNGGYWPNAEFLKRIDAAIKEPG